MRLGPTNVTAAPQNINDSLQDEAGKDELAGTTVEALLVDRNLHPAAPGTREFWPIPFRSHKSRAMEYADPVFEFVLDNVQATSAERKRPRARVQFRQEALRDIGQDVFCRASETALVPSLPPKAPPESLSIAAGL